MKLKSLLISGIIASNLFAANYSMELLSGVVSNANSDIIIRRPNKENIVLKNAEIETHAQTVPFYYGLRVTRWSDDQNAWEFAHLHQKLYVDEPNKYHSTNADIQNWEVTDGFNFFVLNKVHKYSKYNIKTRIGGGLVIAHPDITIDGVLTHKSGNGAITWGDGYQLAGFVVQTSVQKSFDITKQWYLNLETRVSYAKAAITLKGGGDTTVTNKALHLNYGIGYKF